jgi:hypothetical protein
VRSDMPVLLAVLGEAFGLFLDPHRYPPRARKPAGTRDRETAITLDPRGLVDSLCRATRDPRLVLASFRCVSRAGKASPICECASLVLLGCRVVDPSESAIGLLVATLASRRSQP